MKQEKSDNEACQSIVLSLRQKGKRASVADVSAATAIPLSKVRELMPKIADEFSGRLEVTQSGEILYSFPQGFTSRYRGLGAVLKRGGAKFIKFIKASGAALFKVWIMVMLIGYFLLFIALSVAAMALSMAGSSKSSSRSRNSGVLINPFGLVWRLWFYSELTKPRRYQAGKPVKKGRPLHKSIFSFVFGEDDPNKNWLEVENKAVINYVQSNNGVISLVEYMAFCGKGKAEAEESLMAFCAKYGGSPEATEEGTIVYRFDELMLRADTRNFAELSPPIQRLKRFSDNQKSMNMWFTVINAVNLVFGSYFIYNALNTGMLATELHYQNASYLYAFVYSLFTGFTANPLPFMGVVLGFIPLIFSVLFWLIPLLRRFLESSENEKIKLSNFKRLGFSKIWSSPENVEAENIQTSVPECRPENISYAQNRVIKDMGAVFNPDVEIGANGRTCYTFKGLETEKQALEEYRAGIDPSRARLGETVFDSAT